MKNNSQSGSSLLAVMFTMAAVSSLVAIMLSVTANNTRMAGRTVHRAEALAYGDAVIEQVYEQWRQAMISVTDATDRRDGLTNSALATKISAPTTAVIAAPTNISLVSAPTVLAATPLLVELTAPSARPAAESGTNWTQRTRLYYVATVAVNFPVMRGMSTVTIKRSFVRSGRSIFDNFYFGAQPVTEFHPGAPMYIGGTAYIGGDLYTAHDFLHFQKDVTFLGTQTMDYRVADSRRPGTAPTIPTNGFGDNWDINNPPHRGSEQKLLDVSTNLMDPNFLDDSSLNDTDSDGNKNNDGYHEIIEEKVTSGTTGTDPLQIDPYLNDDQTGSERLSANSDYRVVVAADNSVTIYAGTSATPLASTSAEYVALKAAITTNTAIKDVRDADYVKLVVLDVSSVKTSSDAGTLKDRVGGGDGITLYIKDTSSGNTGTTVASGNQTKIVNSSTGALVKTVTSGGARGVKLVKGGVLPTAGFTVVSPHSVYIAGDYNTGSNTVQPPSNTASSYNNNANPSPVVGSYVRPPSSVVGDAVNILSNAWNDANSDLALTSRVSTPTTINTAIVAGNVPTRTGSGNYSGGIENFVRFHEKWAGKYATIYGATALLYDSEEATQPWGAASYGAPDRHWYYDPLLSDRNPPGFHVARIYERGRWVLR